MSFISSNGARKSSGADHMPAKISGAPNPELCPNPKTAEQHRAAQEFHEDLAEYYRAAQPNARWRYLAGLQDRRAKHHKSQAEHMEAENAAA